jgi:N-acetylmuramoyl-L-alanine amidase
VPVEFINRALGVIYDMRLDLRKPSRLLIVGDLRVPRVVVRVDNGSPARLMIDASPQTTSTMIQESNALNVKFDADALDVLIPSVAAGNLLRAVRVQEPATLIVELGPGFGAFRAATQPLETSTRLTIDVLPVQPAPSPAAPASAAASNPPPDAVPPLDLSALSQPAAGIRAIALDPGHGGEDEGVKGAAGTKEKDLALSAASRIKAAIESRLGIRVLLTRDDDRNVALAARAALANNNKVDLFISLHANASFRKTATGASILYAAFDRQEEESARTSLAPVRLPAFGGGLRDLDLVFWDLAQLRHLTRSEELARILQAEFHDKIPLSAHPVDRAPLDVLKSVNMPAVLIEMGYLTNAEQEARMASAEFQNTLVQAVFDSVLRYRELPASGTR